MNTHPEEAVLTSEARSSSRASVHDPGASISTDFPPIEVRGSELVATDVVLLSGGSDDAAAPTVIPPRSQIGGRSAPLRAQTDSVEINV